MKSGSAVQKAPGRPVKNGPGYVEFLALTAVIISITALSIDMMLPALPDIGYALNTRHPNDAQLIISLLVFGFGIGQILFGPLSDCFGRRPVIFIGFVIFTAGCLLSVSAGRFDVMLAGRFIQGIGAAGPRTAIVALIRDQYGGRAMARIMSVIMAIFIFVPAIAPAIGQVILLMADWRMIFAVLMCQGLAALLWFALRQPETLKPENRIPFTPARIFRGLAEVCTHRVALGYTVASGFMSGALLGYLNSAQQIFQQIYGIGREFPVYMACLALSVGCASFVNSRIVMRIGMRTLSWRAVFCFIAMAGGYLIAILFRGGHSPLWVMMPVFILLFFCLGILFGNQNAIAMEPLAHIAGMGAAVIGCLASLMASLLGMAIGRFFNGTVIPLVTGFLIFGLLAAAAMSWADRSRSGR